MNMKKFFIGLLIVNLFIGVGLFMNFKYNEKQELIAVEKKQKEEKETKEREEAARKDVLAVCIQFGPFNNNEKASFDAVVERSNFLKHNLESFIVARTNLYQLYWSLGYNEEEARKLFDRQKRGALSDEKFQLTLNDEKKWVVNITEAAGDENLAKTLTQELAEKADLINTGGTWEYKKLNDAYFYRFDTFNMIEDNLQEELISISVNKKQPCVE